MIHQCIEKMRSQYSVQAPVPAKKKNMKNLQMVFFYYILVGGDWNHGIL